MIECYQAFSPRPSKIISVNHLWRMNCIFVLMACVGLLGCKANQVVSPADDADPHPPLSSEPLIDSSVVLPPIPLAIYSLKNMSPSRESAWVGPMLTELLVSDLSHWPHLRIISREAAGAVLREQWLQYQPSHSNELVQLGRLQGARFMIQGGVIEHEGKVTIDLQIIDVETGVIWDTVRDEGHLDELPRLEQSLVRQLVERLSREENGMNPTSLDVEQARSPRPSRPGRSTMNLERGQPSRESQSQVVVQAEMALLLESRTRDRFNLLETARNMFQQGITVEVGRPHYPAGPMSGDVEIKGTTFLLPVAFYAEESRIRNLIAQEISPEMTARVFESTESSSLSPSGDGLVERQFFIEQVLRPRRVFVRALSGQGEVVAVFSRWDWRTDRVIAFTDQVFLKMPWWPTPLFTGMAEFPIHWLEGEEAVLTFDTVVVDVNHQERDVAVEWIDSPFSGSLSSARTESQERLSRHLKTWIQDHWAPSLAETLPFKGYLPGNKQLAYLRLHVDQGIITQLDHQYSSSDPVFISNIEQLTAQLLGACPWCEAGQDLPEILRIAEFRIQCMLLKSSQNTGLGSRLP